MPPPAAPAGAHDAGEDRTATAAHLCHRGTLRTRLPDRSTDEAGSRLRHRQSPAGAARPQPRLRHAGQQQLRRRDRWRHAALSTAAATRGAAAGDAGTARWPRPLSAAAAQDERHPDAAGELACRADAELQPGCAAHHPHLDALHREGLRTDGLIAGGRRTVEGFFTALCSYQNPLEAGIPNTPLQDQHYECLPKLLSDAGWSTAVFQGMHKGETGQLAQLLGTQASYGKLEMPVAEVEQNSWGYQDPDLYRFILSKARAESRPFFYMVNNTTTHDDQLPPGEPWLFGDQSSNERQMSVLHYADKALGRFIEEYQQANLGPTLFVITADHTAGERSGHMGRYWIPFLMFATDGSIAPRHEPGIGAQQDIAPTILDLLGGKAPWFTGHSLLSEAPRGGSMPPAAP
ncbi:LTA synthase family protein [Aeromonas jandaei]|nr:LTA synthase family protein [Aeromonas jandaei]